MVADGHAHNGMEHHVEDDVVKGESGKYYSYKIKYAFLFITLS